MTADPQRWRCRRSIEIVECRDAELHGKRPSTPQAFQHCNLKSAS
jgi:hypothetical protein